METQINQEVPSKTNQEVITMESIFQKDQEHKNYKLVVEWSNNVDYILETTRLIIENARFSNELFEGLFKLAKEEDDKYMLSILEDDNKIRKQLDEFQRLTGQNFVPHLDNAEMIEYRVLQCTTILTDAIRKNMSFRTNTDGMTIKLLNLIISDLDWFVERIDVKENELRIDEISGFIVQITSIRQNIVKVNAIFDSRHSLSGNYESIMSQMLQVSLNQRYQIAASNIDANGFFSYASEHLKKEILEKYASEGKEFLTPEILKNIYKELGLKDQQTFLTELISILDIGQSALLERLMEDKKKNSK